MAKKATTPAQIGAYSTMVQTQLIGLITNNSDKISEIDGFKIQEAIDFPNKENFVSELILWINNGSKLSIDESFKYGDVFFHSGKDDCGRLAMNSTFFDKVVRPNARKIITKPAELSELKEYYLLEDKSDTAIEGYEHIKNKGYIDSEKFLYTLYLLIFKPQLAKNIFGFTLKQNQVNYVFHVRTEFSGVLTINAVHQPNNKWSFASRSFDSNVSYQYSTFIYF